MDEDEDITLHCNCTCSYFVLRNVLSFHDLTLKEVKCSMFFPQLHCSPGHGNYDWSIDSIACLSGAAPPAFVLLNTM